MSAPSDTNASLGIVLRPRRLRLLGCLAICLGFTVIGGAAIANGEPLGWLVAGVFGIGAAVFLVAWPLGAGDLRIAADGITTRSVFRSETFPWQDIDRFGVTEVQGRPMVGFNLRGGGVRAQGRKEGRLTRLSRAVAGYDAALPGTYGLAADELASLLNRALAAFRGSQ